VYICNNTRELELTLLVGIGTDTDAGTGTGTCTGARTPTNNERIGIVGKVHRPSLSLPDFLSLL
jgi:hypothetical protein